MGPIDRVPSVAPAAGLKRAGPPQARPETDARPARLPLAPADPAPPGPRGSGERPLAAFLTHLIATAEDAPQTRRLRRAAVSDAVSAYAATAARVAGAEAGTAISGRGYAA